MTQLNKYSSRITQPKSQGALEAMLYGTGLQPADMDKAQIGIASMWYEGNTCNMHLNDLAAHVKEGVTTGIWLVCASTRLASAMASAWARRYELFHCNHAI